MTSLIFGSNSIYLSVNAILFKFDISHRSTCFLSLSPLMHFSIECPSGLQVALSFRIKGSTFSTSIPTTLVTHAQVCTVQSDDHNDDRHQWPVAIV